MAQGADKGRQSRTDQALPRHGTSSFNATRGGEVASTELARKINRDTVLELIRLCQPIARVDLARSSGLQNSTVSAIVEQLLREQWIREGEALKTARGRRPTLLSLNDSLAMLVADIHPGSVAVGVVDLNGHLLVQEQIDLQPGVQQSIDTVADALERLRASHADRTLMGLGVCIPGRVRSDTGRVVMAPNLHWQDFDIRGALEARLGLTVELENDANACLLSELWFGRLEGVRNAVLLAISEGVGASLLANAHLVSGRLGLAGEFGHICFKPDGPLCGCGRHGCWEVFASSTAALSHYRDLLPDAPSITYAQLASLAESGDAAARTAIQQQARAIGQGLRMVTAALAPELILFAGDISNAWPIAEPIILEECRKTLLAGPVPRVVCTAGGRKAHLLGAAALLLQRHAAYYHARPAQRGGNTQLVARRA